MTVFYLTDEMMEFNMKIFADVFEAIIGAVFLDSKSLNQVWTVFKKLINKETLEYHGDIMNFIVDPKS